MIKLLSRIIAACRKKKPPKLIASVKVAQLPKYSIWGLTYKLHNKRIIARINREKNKP